MRLIFDWAVSNTAERFLNLALRPFGLDCFVERHLGEWQWGMDQPQIIEGNVLLMRGYEPPRTWDLWLGPVHIMLARV